MPRATGILAAAVLLLATVVQAWAWPSPHTLGTLTYLSPAPGSTLHPPETNLIVRPGGAVDASSYGASTIQVSGSVSGVHAGLLELSDDGATLRFRPQTPFTAGERVTCSIAPGIRTDPGGIHEGQEFTFDIAPPPAAGLSLLSPLDDEVAFVPHPFFPPTRAARLRADSIPDDLPELSIVASGHPSEGLLFLSDIRFGDNGYRSHLMALGDDGTPQYARLLTGNGFDFKLQPNGRITYFDDVLRQFYVLNANFALRDSLRCGNGYTTDIHELQLLPNGHALLIAYDPRTIDMSAVVPGGNTQATVIGLVIQELDRSKEVVFQWRSWDHFQITDCANVPLTAARVDYAHGNAIEPDNDGNLLLSSRHLDEITKISRSSGAILWRLGGANNEFTFTNDPDRFSMQHSIRRLANGHLLLFDNGNYHVPARSRAVEYAVDEVAKTATRVWEYRKTPDVYGSAMGSVQRLPNGNTMIGWGSTSPALTEVTPSGSEVFQLALPPSVYSYRAFRFAWPPVLPVALAIPSGASMRAGQGGGVTVVVSGAGFAADSLDSSSVRLAGIAPEAFTPVPGGAAQFRFPADLILATQAPGRRRMELTGSLVSGERIRGAVDVTIEGSRRIGARMASTIGSVPIRIALRSDGVTERQVRLAAYDIRGRRVAAWTTEVSASGIALWDGRGRGHAPVPSGIYYLRTEGSALSETAKVIVAR